MNNPNQVSIEELRINLSDIINQVSYRNGRIVVKKYNREAAIILSPNEYAKLLDPTKRLATHEWEKTVKRIEAVQKKIPIIKDETALDRDIKQAIKKVRATRKVQKQKQV